jgi:serine/threonine-protein kinase SRPK3
MSNNSYESVSSEEEIDWECKFLQNKYIILKKLGYGSYASVWLCYNIDESIYYAVKISNKDDYKACLKETNTYNQIKKFNCEYIMSLKQTFDVKENDDLYHCEVMELMGDSLYNHVKYNGSLKLQTLINITKQILIAVDNLHKNNIIHGDLKPENILLTNKSNNTNMFIKNLNIEKIIKNKTLMKEHKSRDKILDEIKKQINKIDINLEYLSSNNNNESDNDSELLSDICSEDSVSTAYTLSSTSDEESNLSNKSSFIENNNSNLSIKLTDMGCCVMTEQKRKKQIQTCYYMSPEILLRLPYDKSSDMWALACTLYEIFTGKILFDPDDYDGNEDRYHLYLITKSLGSIPGDIINASRYKDILFTNDCKRIRGFRDCENTDLKKNLLNKIKYDCMDDKDKELAEKFYDEFFIKCLDYDINKRITSTEALKLNFFM